MKYVKKPIVVEAVQWFVLNDVKEVSSFETSSPDDKCSQCGHFLGNHGQIDTLEGVHIVCPGDYIIEGIQGEKYPCKPDIFVDTYDKVK